ncbi:hypothetical protein NEOC65_001130 [Neochlamydia sp. AcF65]|nr:hypothetical protein [Neochlamydia sp. AcF65]
MQKAYPSPILAKKYFLPTGQNYPFYYLFLAAYWQLSSESVTQFL